MTIDEKIKAAAQALSEALTEGGKDYYVTAESTHVTQIQSSGREFVWNIRVEETSWRRIAP